MLCKKLINSSNFSLSAQHPLLAKIIKSISSFKAPLNAKSQFTRQFSSLEELNTQSNLKTKQELDTNKKQFIVPTGTGGRYRVDYVLNHPDLIGQIITIKGWARTVRVQGGGSFAFIEVNDGSSVKGIQIVVNNSFPDFNNLKGTGISISCKGLIIKSPGKGQTVEMQIEDSENHSFAIIGDCEQSEYPISKKNHTPEFLREKAHLRSRTNLIGAVSRVRNALAFATHSFFNSRGFLYIQTPIITASDCEGAGELFKLSSEKKEGNNEEFFGKPAFLTCSGQLNVETYCCALSDVYTFGPTFRAENSHTTRHLAEFWMIEPEMAWAGLEENIECSESYLKFCIKYALDNCAGDLEFFDKFVEKGLIERLRNVLDKPFERISYTDAIDIILKSKKQFKVTPVWGDDLNSEHERYISEEIIKGPVIVCNYPKVLKAFYMKVNDDDKTVQAMDILVPKIGEVIGGSAREDRLEQLDRNLEFKNLDKEKYWWYRDLRKFGSVPHAGFGLGFERLIMMVTGVENIRETIPFPRWPGHAEF